MVPMGMKETELLARIGGERRGNVCKILTGELEGERPLERDRRSWCGNITKHIFREIFSDGANRIQLAQDR
jgi:hypothetical protein